jgi:hypothetical protein
VSRTVFFPYLLLICDLHNGDVAHQKLIYKNTRDARQRKYDVIKLGDREIMRIYKEEVRKGITGNFEEQNNEIDGTSETTWENTERVVTAVVNEVCRYAERKNRDDWYDEECQIQVEEDIRHD